CSYSPGRKEVDHQVAVGVESTSVTDVTVVVVDGQGVVELRPADALDADRKLLTLFECVRSVAGVAGRKRGGRVVRGGDAFAEQLAILVIEGNDALFDVVRGLGFNLRTVHHEHHVPAPETDRNRQSRRETTIRDGARSDRRGGGHPTSLARHAR